MLSAAVKNAAPAALRPVAHSWTLDTGILFPVFFWPFASRVRSLHKAGVLKIPAVPGAAIPESGLAPFPFARAKSLRFALFFCPRSKVHGFVDRHPVGRFDNHRYRNGGMPIE